MEYIQALPWQQLTSDQAEKIVAQFNQHKQLSKRITSSSSAGDLHRVGYADNMPGYFHLTDWPDKIEFFQGLFVELPNDVINLGRLSIQCSVGKLLPHTDFERKVSILCVLEGPADTVFYKHKTQSAAGRVFNYQDIDEVLRVRLEPYTWYLFNNAAIHSVENYMGRRIGLTLDIGDKFDNYQQAQGVLF